MMQNSAERLNNFIELHVQFRSTEGDCLFWMQQTLNRQKRQNNKEETANKRNSADNCCQLLKKKLAIWKQISEMGVHHSQEINLFNHIAH